MKILIANENVFGGGTESQVSAEVDLLRRKGHEVHLVTYDPTYEGESLFEEHVNVSFTQCSGLRKWLYQLLGEREFGKRLAAAIVEIHPDAIHLNNVFSRPRDVYAAVKPWPVLQTLRDYSVICPRDVCCDGSWRECGGWRYHGDISCQPHAVCALQHCKLEAINGFRARAVDKMVSCSARMAEKCGENGLDVEQLRDLLAPERIFKDVAIHNGSFLYYGRLAEEKGTGVLLEAFDIFAQKVPNAHLMLAGSVEPKFNDVLNRFKDRPWFEYLGLLNLEELKRVYTRTFAVVVPSLWLDNYPNTALEAMANNTLVIGSNRGGLPEMLGRDELLFDPLEKYSLVERLVWSWNLSKDEYNEIVAERCVATRALASENAYYEGLMAGFEDAIALHREMGV